MYSQADTTVQSRASAASNSRIKDATAWKLTTRIAFRFVSLFLLLLIVPFPFESDDAPNTLPWLWHRVVPWVGIHICHFSGTRVAHGDNEFYLSLQLLTYILIAALGTLLWSLAGRNARAHPRLHNWLRLYARIYLATVIFSYGTAKLFPEQFRSPSLARMLQPLGDYQPNALMWAFIGSSRLYTLFAGAVEALAGLLLFIPPLAAIGALLCFTALANVFLLDMSYDVGVRTYCAVLMFLCLFLLAPEVRRLADVFIFNRRVEPAPRPPLFQRKRLNQAMVLAQVVIAVYMMGLSLAEDRRDSRVRDEALLHNPLRGIWSVDEFDLNGQLRPPLTTDPIRWQRVVLDSPPSTETETGVVDLLTVQSMDGSLHSFDLQFDPSHRQLLLKKATDADWRAHFALSQPQTGVLLLDGKFDDNLMHVKLRITHPHFRLSASRFHWPQEYVLDPWNP